MRAFIAADFNELSGYLQSLQNSLPKAKATFPKEFHLTLKFLGDITELQAEAVRKKLAQVRFVPFKANLSGLGVFPSEDFIKVVWAGIDDDGNFSRLQVLAENALGLKKDKGFQPHITLARIKFIEEKSKKEFAEALKQIAVEKKEIEIREFKLMKSTLTPEGPVYEVIESYNL